MRMTGEEFLAWPRKAITLLGMSGVGKTTLAYKPAQVHSGFTIPAITGSAPSNLAEPILDNIKRQAMQVDFLRDLLRSDSIYIASNVTVHNLAPVASFLGKIGREDLGGLNVDEFKGPSAAARAGGDRRHVRRGTVHPESPRDLRLRALHSTTQGGASANWMTRRCWMCSPATQSIVYLSADKAMEDKMIRRSIENPKPMYYQETFLDEQLQEFLAANGLSSPAEIVPDEFVRWIFPRHMAHRRPKYEDACGPLRLHGGCTRHRTRRQRGGLPGIDCGGDGLAGCRRADAEGNGSFHASPRTGTVSPRRPGSRGTKRGNPREHQRRDGDRAPGSFARPARGVSPPPPVLRRHRTPR